MLTRQEIAQKATAASVRAARSRRFAKYADEIRQHPEDLDETSQIALVEALDGTGLWFVQLER